MVDRNILLESLPPFKNEKNLLVEDQVTFDIINEILKAHRIYASDYDKISSFFWQGDPVSTAEYIFDFAKQNIKYDVEPSTRQTVKSPSAIIATGMYATGFNDCKHYSQFIAGILDSLKRMGYEDIDWNYRFVNYRIFESDPQHVFVVLRYNGNEYWIDPVFESFNERNPYINKIDKKVNMSLYSLAGKPKRMIGATSSNAVSIPPDVSRAAYISMLSKNLLGSASSLLSLIQKNPSVVQKWWEGIGGNFSQLKSIAMNCYSIIPNEDDVANNSEILAASVPMLSEISILARSDKNAQSAFQIAYEYLQYYYSSYSGNKVGSISDLFGQVQTNAGTALNYAVPGAGTAISPTSSASSSNPTSTGILSVLTIIPSLFGGGSSSSFSPSGRAAQVLPNMQSTLASRGLAAGVYADFAQSNNAGGLNLRISQSDGDSLLVWDGTSANNYIPTGVSLSKNFGGNLKDMAIYATSTGYQPTAVDQSYWTWLKGIANGTVAIPTVAATAAASLPSTTSAIYSPGSSTNSLLTPTNLLIAAAAATAIYAVSKSKK